MHNLLKYNNVELAFDVGNSVILATDDNIVNVYDLDKEESCHNGGCLLNGVPITENEKLVLDNLCEHHLNNVKKLDVIKSLTNDCKHAVVRVSDHESGEYHIALTTLVSKSLIIRISRDCIKKPPLSRGDINTSLDIGIAIYLDITYSHHKKTVKTDIYWISGVNGDLHILEPITLDNIGEHWCRYHDYMAIIYNAQFPEIPEHITEQLKLLWAIQHIKLELKHQKDNN